MENTYDVEIKGTRPLLMHSPAMVGVDRSSRKSTNYDPQEEAENALYRDKEGKICVPSRAILAMLREAGKPMKAKGKGRMSLSKFLLAGIEIDPEMIPITPQEYEVDSRPVVVQKARIIRCRPMFTDWSLNFRVSIVDTEVLDATTVRNALENSGKFNGLLDNRPANGKFQVVRMVHVPTGKEVK
jgi:hypothetical protein